MGLIARRSKGRGGITNGTPLQTFEGAVTTGTSPVTLDLNAQLSRNAIEGYVRNDGTGDFTVKLSTDGVTYSDEATIKDGESFNFDDMSVDSIVITRVAADSNYRVAVI